MKARKLRRAALVNYRKTNLYCHEQQYAEANDVYQKELGSSSNWTPVISGGPQGAILGPLCFLLYIHDLPNRISSSIKLFADDCKVYRDIKRRSDCYKLQHDLKKTLSMVKRLAIEFWCGKVLCAQNTKKNWHFPIVSTANN